MKKPFKRVSPSADEGFRVYMIRSMGSKGEVVGITGRNGAGKSTLL